MGKKYIHPHVRTQTVVLHDVALNQVQVAKQLKVSRCCVQSPIKIYKQLGRFDDLKYAERPRELSKLEIRHLKRLVKEDSRLGASKIAMELSTSLLQPVTTRTIRRYLKELAFEYVVKMKKQ